jgi:hypothetical protein
MARRHPRRRAGDAGSDGTVETLPGLASAVEKTKLTSGPMCQRVDREKAPGTEGVNQRRKRIFTNTPTTRVGRAAWVGKVGFGLREERGQ